MACKQLRLLLWKNLLVKRRACCNTICEFAIPLVVLLLIVVIRLSVKVKDIDKGDFNNLGDDNTPLMYSINGGAPIGGGVTDSMFDLLLQKLVCGGDALPSIAVLDYAHFAKFAVAGPHANNVITYLKKQIKAYTKPTINCCVPNIFCKFDHIENTTVFVDQKMFIAFDNEDQLDQYTEQHRYGWQSTGISPLLMGMVIQEESTNQWFVKYRLNYTETPLQGVGTPTNKFNVGFDRDVWSRYVRSGLMSVMYLTDNYIFDQNNPTLTQVDILPFPVAGHKKDQFADFINGAVFGLFLILSFMYPFARLVRSIVDEKERRLKEGMRMMGLQNLNFWVSWILTYVILFFLFSCLATLFTKSSVYKYSDGGIVFLTYFIFGLDLVALGVLAATIFNRAQTASTSSLFILLAFFMPYFGVTSDATSESARNAVCLVAPACFAEAQQVFLDYEQIFVGVNYDNINDLSKNIRFSTTLLMMTFDFFLYLLIAVYFELVLPKEFGTNLPFYFFLQPSWWSRVLTDDGKPANRGSRLSQSDALGTYKPPQVGNSYSPLLDQAESSDSAYVAMDEKMDIPSTPSSVGQPSVTGSESSAVVEESVSHALRAKALVTISGLRKEFPVDHSDKPFVAVKGLNLELYEGQIFVLLGHNGAGKTTTINMLTGLLPPTSGTALLDGHDINYHMEQIRHSMGTCPQHDILWDTLTVEEHLRFFAKLKNVPDEMVESEVKLAIEEVQLQGSAKQMSAALSGGQKRRLSLAIALIGDSKIVFLDEPTSGVDPFSRRAIWNLLSQKKERRVIVLTTHFMDEADQLGDRIGIMHHGQLVCVGSPLFLKKTYGVGYTMVVTKDDQKDSRAIKDAVREHVEEAKSLSDVGTEVSFQLPLAASAKFPALLKHLDDNGPALGVANYGLSVTTLEEVFLKVGTAETSAEKREETRQHIRRLSSVDARKSRAQTDFERQGSSLLDASVGHRSFCRDFQALLQKRYHITKRDRRAAVCQFLIPFVVLVLGLSFIRINPAFTFPTVQLAPADQFPGTTIPYNNGQPAYTNLMNQVGNEDFKALGVNAPTHQNFSDYLFESRGQQVKYGGIQWQDSTGSFTVWNNVSALQGIPAWFALASNALFRSKNGGNGGITYEIRPFELTKQEKNSIQALNGMFSSFIIAIAFSFIPASFAVFVVKEREIKATHLQRISGLGMVAYWTSNYVWDFIQYFVSMLMVSIVLLAFGNEPLTGSNFSTVFLIFLLFGLSVIPFTYMVSFAFKSHSTAQNAMIISYMVFGVVLLLASVALFLIPSTRSANKVLRYFFRLAPNFCLSDGIFRMSIRSFPDVSLSQWDLETTGFDFIFMALESIIFFGATIVLEYMSSDPLLAAKLNNDPQLPLVENVKVDEDVAAERQRIQSGQADNDAIRLEGIRKCFPPNRIAVHDLWYAIPTGQCFGFLGVNGAGKTTTLKILTGDVPASAGQAFLGGMNIADHPLEVRRMMGFCPQFDALHEYLTAKETLEFYGRIRGIPEERLEHMIKYLIERLTLKPYMNRPAGTYSGGNKRKLSVAIALIGNPRVVFLDEPSTGMDPVSRRFMWDFIAETMADRAVILTTHSMEECEALCSRIGILVLGDLKCIGSSQHLKSRFGQGYQLDVSGTEASVPQIRQFVAVNFPGSEELECYGGHMKFRVPPLEMKLGQMFMLVEQNKDDLGIAEYSIGQTTLEQIFISFARAGDPAAIHQAAMEARQQALYNAAGTPKAQPHAQP